MHNYTNIKASVTINLPLKPNPPGLFVSVEEFMLKPPLPVAAVDCPVPNETFDEVVVAPPNTGAGVDTVPTGTVLLLPKAKPPPTT